MMCWISNNNGSSNKNNVLGLNSVYSFSPSSIFVSPARVFGVHGWEHVAQSSHSLKIEHPNPHLVHIHVWVLHKV